MDEPTRFVIQLKNGETTAEVDTSRQVPDVITAKSELAPAAISQFQDRCKWGRGTAWLPKAAW